MRPTDSVIRISREKARQRIDTVLASMDTIHLYMTAAALWRRKDDTTLYQPDIEIYATCARILAEDILYKPQPPSPERDSRIGVVVKYLSKLDDQELAEVTPLRIRECIRASKEDTAAAKDPPNILQFPGCY